MRPSARQALASAFDALESGVATRALIDALEAPTRAPPVGPPEPPLLGVLAARRRPPRSPSDRWRVGAWLPTGIRADLLARLEAHDVLHTGITRRLDRVFEIFRSAMPPMSAEPRASRLADAIEDDVRTLTRG